MPRLSSDFACAGDDVGAMAVGPVAEAAPAGAASRRAAVDGA